MMRIWVGAAGLMSRNAMQCSSSHTRVDGISSRKIAPNMVGLLLGSCAISSSYSHHLAQSLETLLCIEQHGHWTVVAQRNLHICSKASRLHKYTICAQCVDKFKIQRLCFARLACTNKTRPAPIRANAEERKLRHHDAFAADTHKRQIHLAGII